MNDAKLDITSAILIDLAEQYAIDQKYVKQLLLTHLDAYSVEKLPDVTVDSDLHSMITYFLKLKQLEGIAKSTIDTYKAELLFFSTFVDKPVKYITINDLRSYLSIMQNKQLKRTTLNNKITTLRSFFKTLFIEEVIGSDPSVKLKLFRVDTSTLRTCLSIEELEKLRNACIDIREKVLVEFFFATGCRLSEVMHVKLIDINGLDNSLNVIGKGNKIRKVFFTPKCKLYIQEYLETRPAKSDSLFASYRYPYDPIGKPGLERALSRIVARTNIEKSVSPHVLRHTMTSANVQHGMDLLTVSKLLGHAKLSTTQIYTHINDSSLKTSYDKFM